MPTFDPTPESMTLPAVRDRTKTVTRRHPDTWQRLAPGDRLTLIEKGMGLPKGAKQVIVAEVEVLSNRVEPLTLMESEPGACAAEGFPEMTPAEFMDFWCKGHGSHPGAWRDRATLCRRIAWRYL